MCKDPEIGKSLKHPWSWKKGSGALEAIDRRTGIEFRSPQPAFLSIPATSTANAFLVAPTLFLSMLCTCRKCWRPRQEYTPCFPCYRGIRDLDARSLECLSDPSLPPSSLS